MRRKNGRGNRLIQAVVAIQNLRATTVARKLCDYGRAAWQMILRDTVVALERYRERRSVGVRKDNRLDAVGRCADPHRHGFDAALPLWRAGQDVGGVVAMRLRDRLRDRVIAQPSLRRPDRRERVAQSARVARRIVEVKRLLVGSLIILRSGHLEWYRDERHSDAAADRDGDLIGAEALPSTLAALQDGRGIERWRRRSSCRQTDGAEHERYVW